MEITAIGSLQGLKCQISYIQENDTACVKPHPAQSYNARRYVMHRYGMDILQRQPSDYILNIPGVRFIEPAFSYQA